MNENHEINVPLFTNISSTFDKNKFLRGGKNITTDSTGAALNRYRKSIKLNMDDLSLMIGTSKTMLFYYLKGTRKITFNVLVALCIALRLHPIRIDYVFSLSQFELRESEPRYAILKSFLYGCAWNEKLTLDYCNIVLKSNNLEPLLPEKEEE